MRPDVHRPFETTWEDWTLGGGLLQAFERPGLPLEVEIGPGEDDFLLEQALRHPDRNWLGIEYSRKRVHRYARRTTERAGPLGNLRLAWRPAADVVRPFLSPGRVERFHVYFPDPWPKKHHHRYRMLSLTFLEDLGAALVPGGEVRMLTDHLDYAEEIAQVVSESADLANVVGDPGYEVVAAGDRTTVFEDQWRSEGLPIHRLRFLRAEVTP